VDGYGRDHSNPKGGHPIAWDSPRTQKLMTDACMDCQYKPLHPGARLSDKEKQHLIRGIRATFGP
jgi:hypothetical protein